MNLPESFVTTIQRTWGASGIDWLKSLDVRIALLTLRWQLTDIVLFPDLSYAFVAHAKSPHGPVVLKLSCDELSLHREWLALSAYAGNGAVRVYEYDSDQGALLLERLEPGTVLAVDDEEATAIVAELIKKFKVTSENCEFPDMKEWFRALYIDHPEIPQEYLMLARRWVRELIEEAQPCFLAHGDLHQGNVLASERGWVAIDPKGVLAPFGFDVGAYMRNPLLNIINNPNRSTLIGRRFDQFADLLASDREFLVRVSFSQAVLAACWSLEESSADWKNWLICALSIKNH